MTMSGPTTPVAVRGDPDACVEGARDVIDAGAEMILFTSLRDEAADGTRHARSSRTFL
jgi:hypothetical protein